jgi:ABC-type branched-subunit amino acid transport system substrate-binding protein
MNLGYIGTFSGYGPGISATEQLVLGIHSYLDGASGPLTIDGEPVHCLTGDDQGDPATGVCEARRLIEGKGVPVLVFVAASIVMEAVLEYASSVHVPIAGTGGAVLPRFRPADPWLFTARTPYESHAAAFVDELVRQGVRRIALVSTLDATGRSYAAGLRGKLAEWGLEPAAELLFARRDTDLHGVMRRLADAEPELAVCTHFAPTSGALVRAAARLGLAVRWAFGPSASSPETARVAGHRAVEGALGQSSFEALSSDSSTVAAFLADVRHGSPEAEVTSLTQLGYVTARAVVDAARRAQEWSGDEIRAALETLEADYGMLPPFRLGPDEHLLNRGVQLLRFGGGGLQPLGPMRVVDPDTWDVRAMPVSMNGERPQVAGGGAGEAPSS